MYFTVDIKTDFPKPGRNSPEFSLLKFLPFTYHHSYSSAKIDYNTLLDSFDIQPKSNSSILV